MARRKRKRGPTAFVLLRCAPSTVSFANWSIVDRFNDFSDAVDERERQRRLDSGFSDGRWEYKIEPV